MYKPGVIAPFSKLIISIYGSSPKLLKNIFDHYLAHYEGGWYWSSSLRKIYLKCYGIDIGIGSYGCFKPQNFPQGTNVGNYCSIARDVTRLNANHPYQYATMHPISYDSNVLNNIGTGVERIPLTIGHDVWIGCNTIITKSCKVIGNGAVVGAGSVVTKDIPSYAIVAGNPARIIKMRFDEETIQLLEESNWFNLPPESLSKIIKYVENPREFAERAIGMWNEL